MQTDQTYVAGDDTVYLSLPDERCVVRQGVTSGHGLSVGLFVQVLTKK